MSKLLRSDSEGFRVDDSARQLLRDLLDAEPARRTLILNRIREENPEKAEVVQGLLVRLQQFESLSKETEPIQNEGSNAQIITLSHAETVTESGNLTQTATLSEKDVHLTRTATLPHGDHPLPVKAPPPEMPERIGPFVIKRKIGKGGMGNVYLAEQEKPHREVALKLISKHDVSGEFMARFQAEYQALAMMNHRHIASIYDVGSTEDGHPYFTMEYIEGIPINLYCNRNNLNMNQRLVLFLQVCDAVLHAHQKAVIHRDLKPANILVAHENGQPIVKIIDFGLAKGLDHALIDNAFETLHGAVIGTPAYMSPEQLAKRRDHSDIRSDVYALGIVLYELITGRHPLNLEDLDHAPLNRVLKSIEVQKITRPPSELLMESSDPNAGNIKKIRDDLDWVVMKAMAHEVGERYATVGALQEDLHRYLANEPVSARAPGMLYVLGKFMSRNKLLVSSVSSAVLALVLGLALAVNGYLRADRALEEAVLARQETQKTLDRYQAISTFLQDMLAAPDPSGENTHEVKVVEVLAQAEELFDEGFEGTPQKEAALRVTLGNTYFGLGLYPQAEKHLSRSLALLDQYAGEQSLQDRLETARTHFFLARVLRRLGQPQQASDHFQNALFTQKQLLGPSNRETMRTMSGLAMAFRVQDLYSEAEDLFRDALVRQREVLGEHHPDTLITMTGLANACQSQNKLKEAEQLYRKALGLQRNHPGSSHPQTLATMHSLAECLLRTRKVTEARNLFSEAGTSRSRVLGENHDYTLSSYYGLARSLKELKEYDLSEQVYAEVAARRSDSLGAGNPDTLKVLNKMAILLASTGRYEDAAEVLTDIYLRSLEDGYQDHTQALRALQNLGDVLLKTGEDVVAVVILESKMAREIQIHGKPVRGTGMALATLAKAHDKAGRTEDALHYYCMAAETGAEYFPENKKAASLEELYIAYKARPSK